MLSEGTVRTLDELARRSRTAHPEGGLLYTFTEASDQSHSMFPSQLAEQCSARLTDDGRVKLAAVLSKSLGHLGSRAADSESLTCADKLVECLRRDLAFTRVGIVADEDDDYSWGATVHMARDSDNRYFSLNMWGSID